MLPRPSLVRVPLAPLVAPADAAPGEREAAALLQGLTLVQLRAQAAAGEPCPSLFSQPSRVCSCCRPIPPTRNPSQTLSPAGGAANGGHCCLETIHAVLLSPCVSTRCSTNPPTANPATLHLLPLPPFAGDDSPGLLCPPTCHKTPPFLPHSLNATPSPPPQPLPLPAGDDGPELTEAIAAAEFASDLTALRQLQEAVVAGRQARGLEAVAGMHLERSIAGGRGDGGVLFDSWVGGWGRRG